MIKNYLIHCYLYYGLDTSIISDTEFDKLCKLLLANWRNCHSAYKKYISKNDLEAGTGFTLFYNHKTGDRDYPSAIKTEAETKLAQHRAKTVIEYRVTSDDPQELYNDLKDAAEWFLIGLYADYKFFLKSNPEKQQMSLDVINRIIKERNDEPKTDGESGNDPAIA